MINSISAKSPPNEIDFNRLNARSIVVFSMKKSIALLARARLMARMMTSIDDG